MLRSARLAVAILGVLATGCSDGREPLVVYSPHGRDLLNLFEAEFEKRAPSIDLRYLDMGSQEVLDRVRSERANPQGDVWFGGPDAIFARGAANGLLASFRPSWAEAVPASSRAAGDLYFGTYRTVPVLVWSREAVASEDAPRDWDDLLDERFRGRVLVRDPMASGVMRTVFAHRLALSVAGSGDEAEGLAWLLRLDAATKQYAANPALLFEMLVRGEGDVTVWELTDVLLHRQAGAPVEWAIPSSGTPVIDDSVGIVAGARHRAAAEAFVEFVGSEEAQALAAERAFRIPARTDLAPESLPGWAREVLDRLVVADYDRELAERRGPEWMARWDSEIRGRGGDAP